MTIEAMKDYSYNEHQKLKKSIVLAFCWILLSLLLLFCSSSNDVAIGVDLYQGFVDVLNKPLFNFIFMNLIVVTLCFLPTQKQIEATNYQVVCHELDDGSIRSRPYVVDSDLTDHDEEEEHTEDQENIPVDKHVIFVENTVEERNHHHYHHELELRRLEGRMSKELVIKMREPWRLAIGDMSNEELRFAIDAFISRRKKEMIQENMHDDRGDIAFSDQHFQLVDPI